jgi:hypothetical protein
VLTINTLTGTFVESPAISALSLFDLQHDPNTGTLFGIILNVVPLAPVPSLTEWGMIIFMVFAGLGSLHYLRKRTRV